jgi:hypothetical protein
MVKPYVSQTVEVRLNNQKRGFATTWTKILARNLAELFGRKG